MKIKSASSYFFPVICVREKDGTLRLCINCRELNRKMHPDLHPIPRVQDIMDNLGGNTLYTLLYQGKAYHQGFMAKDSRHLTAFVTPWACMSMLSRWSDLSEIWLEGLHSSLN